MGDRTLIRAVAVALVGVLSGAPALAGQSTPPQASGDSSESLAHIKAALSHPPAIKLAGDRLRFYLEIYGQQTPPFWSFVGSYDLRNGPVKHSTMTGQEFLDSVRPKLLYSSAGITAPELLQFALTNIAAQALIRKAIRDIQAARTQAEVDQIRARIDRELQALKGGGQ
ncbi:MAG TPA: hypothetical protein VLT86_05695 [Vicinamibacterales bacterium]|nr:hypothetical protein [Vicinamibacterales bacterium]